MGCEQIAADKLSKFMNRGTMMWKKWICARGDFFSRLMCKLSSDHRLKGKIPIAIDFRRFFSVFSLRSSIDSKAFFDRTVNFAALSAIGIVLTKSLSAFPLDFEKHSRVYLQIESNILHESSNVSVPRSTCTHPHRLSTPRNQSRVSAHLSSFNNQ